jgi:hypothetical protein
MIKKCFLLLFVGVLFSGTAHAQDLSLIVQNYYCARFVSGDQFLVRLSGDNFSLVQTSEVKKAFTKEKRILTRRLKLINSILRDLKKARADQKKLLNQMNGILVKIFKDQPLPTSLTPTEREIEANNLKVRLQGRLNTLNTVLGLLNNCQAGVSLKKGKGTLLSPSVEAIAAVSNNGVFYGGHRITLPPQKIKFREGRGPFPACIKFLYPDGFISKVYSGFGRDEYLCNAATFSLLSKDQCINLIPNGSVGYLIQSVESVGGNPDLTVSERLDQVRLTAAENQPTVAVLAFLGNNLSRDAEVRLCNAF